MRFRRSQDWFELFRKIHSYIYMVPKVPNFPKILRFKKVFLKKFEQTLRGSKCPKIRFSYLEKCSLAYMKS